MAYECKGIITLEQLNEVCENLINDIGSCDLCDGLCNDVTFCINFCENLTNNDSLNKKLNGEYELCGIWNDDEWEPGIYNLLQAIILKLKYCVQDSQQFIEILCKIVKELEEVTTKILVPLLESAINNFNIDGDLKGELINILSSPNLSFQRDVEVDKIIFLYHKTEDVLVVLYYNNYVDFYCIQPLCQFGSLNGEGAPNLYCSNDPADNKTIFTKFNRGACKKNKCYVKYICGQPVIVNGNCGKKSSRGKKCGCGS